MLLSCGHNNKECKNRTSPFDIFWYLSSVHPSIFLIAKTALGPGGLEPIPADLGGTDYLTTFIFALHFFKTLETE